MSLNSKAMMLGKTLFTWLKLCHQSAPAGFISSEVMQLKSGHGMFFHISEVAAEDEKAESLLE